MPKFCSQLMIETGLSRRTKVANLNKNVLPLRIYEIKHRLRFKIQRRTFFSLKIETTNKDSKSLWRSLKELSMPSKKGKTSTINIGLKISAEVCFEKGAVAEKCNSFYTTVASKLVEKLPKV